MTQNNYQIDSDHARDPIRSRFGGSVVPRSSGLIFSQKVSFGTWELIGEQLFSLADSTTWWIADWLAYGESSFQDRYREAISRTSLKYQTLRNYVWVARRFDLQRRHNNLSFGHHAEVAALEQPEQDYWLRKAEEFNWSRSYLRNAVRASLRERSPEFSPSASHAADSKSVDEADVAAQDRRCDGVTTIILRLTTNQVAEFKAAARSQNQNIADWAMQALKAAVKS